MLPAMLVLDLISIHRPIALTSHVVKAMERIYIINILDKIRCQFKHQLDPYRIQQTGALVISTVTHLKHIETTDAFARLVFHRL